MRSEKKLDAIKEAFNYYHDRNSLTSEDEKELLKFVNELYASVSGVNQQRKLLIDFCTKLELKAKQYSYLIPDEDFIDEYLKNNKLAY